MKEEFRDSVVSVLKSECDSLSLHAHVDGKNDLDLDLWKHATELGWLSAMIQEEFDGLGQDLSMIPLFHREFGHYLAAGDFIGIHTFTAMLQAINDAAFSKRYLPQLAAGQIKPLVPVTDDRISLELKNGVLQGISGPLLGPAGASIAAVRATAENSEPAIAIVEMETPGCTIKGTPVLDQTRRKLYTLQCREAQPLMVLQDDLFKRANRALNTSARLATASDSIGVGYRALQSTVAYLSERQQFGKPIAAFQAIQHRCANIAKDLKLAECQLEAALAKLINGGDDTDDSGAWIALAKAQCDEASTQAAAESIQLHGGVGFTWEYDCHFFLHRTRLNEQLFGSPNDLRGEALDSLTIDDRSTSR